MEKTILITDKDSPLGGAAVREALSRGYKVLTTRQDQIDQEEEQESASASNSQLKEVIWNRRSPVSSKTILLEARRFLARVDHVLVIYSVEKTLQSFHSMTMEDVEERVDRKIKGSIFLIRELLRYYHNEEKGILGFAVDQSHSDEHSPLDAAATGSFESFTDSILRFYQKDQFFFSGFQSVSADTEGYARFILDTLEQQPPKASGQWLRHSDKPAGLFNSLPIIKRQK